MTDPTLGNIKTDLTCRCRESHGTVVCDCGHTHGEHISLSGCGVILQAHKGYNTYCGCTRYSQKHLRQIGETSKEFNNRVGNVII